MSDIHFKWIRIDDGEGAKITRQQLRWIPEGLKLVRIMHEKHISERLRFQCRTHVISLK